MWLKWTDSHFGHSYFSLILWVIQLRWKKWSHCNSIDGSYSWQILQPFLKAYLKLPAFLQFDSASMSVFPFSALSWKIYLTEVNPHLEGGDTFIFPLAPPSFVLFPFPYFLLISAEPKVFVDFFPLSSSNTSKRHCNNSNSRQYRTR